MKKQTGKSKTALKTPSISRAKPAAAKSIVPEVLLGTTGIAVISAAAVGVLGFFAWKNREKILSFVGNYVDLPESWQADESNDDFSSESDVGSLASHTSTYTAPTTEQRM